MLERRGPKAFSIRGPLGKPADDDIKCRIGTVEALGGIDGMRRVYGALEDHTERVYGEEMSCRIMAALDHRFSGVGEWAS